MSRFVTPFANPCSAATVVTRVKRRRQTGLRNDAQSNRCVLRQHRLLLSVKLVLRQHPVVEQPLELLELCRGVLRVRRHRHALDCGRPSSVLRDYLLFTLGLFPVEVDADSDGDGSSNDNSGDDGDDDGAV